MAGMTRAELRARTRFFIDEPVEQNFTNADINIALNVAQLQVQLEINQANEDFFISSSPTTISLVAGTDSYALADGCLSVNRVEDAETGLSIMPIDFNDKAPNGTTSGLVSMVSTAPGNWYLLGNNIGFSPTPAATRAINYWYVPTLEDLDNDNSVSEIPAPYHDMIAVRAAIDAFVKDEADLANLNRLWIEYLDRLRRTVKNRNSMAPQMVRRVGG